MLLSKPNATEYAASSALPPNFKLHISESKLGDNFEIHASASPFGEAVEITFVIGYFGERVVEAITKFPSGAKSISPLLHLHNYAE